MAWNGRDLLPAAAGATLATLGVWIGSCSGQGKAQSARAILAANDTRPAAGDPADTPFGDAADLYTEAQRAADALSRIPSPDDRTPSDPRPADSSTDATHVPPTAAVAAADVVASHPPSRPIAELADSPDRPADRAWPMEPDWRNDTAAADQPTPPDADAETVDSPDWSRARLARDLAAAITDLPAPTDDREPRLTNPLREAVQLLAIELIEPGAATADLEDAITRLSPTEAASIAALRGLTDQLAAPESLDAAAVRRALSEQAEKVRAADPLSVAKADLCWRVESYGRYVPFRHRRFLAGRAHAAILYVEVENFSQEPAADSPTDEFTVELTQKVELFHAADDALIWRTEERTVRDSAMRRRRDFFVVQRLDLPANLTVGKFNLRVTLADARGKGIAQAVIPLEVVADAALAEGR